MQKDFSLQDYMEFYNLTIDKNLEVNNNNNGEDGLGDKGIFLEDKQMTLKN